MFLKTIKFSLSLFLFFYFLLFTFSANAYYSPGKPLGFVNDYVGIFNDEQKHILESKLSQFERESSDEISVVIIQSLKGDTIENFSTELFREWGVGKKENDNGVLILISKEDRKMRIEIGYGLEGVLTDAQSSWIIKDVMKPAFQEENYYLGIDEAVDTIISVIEGNYLPLESENLDSGLFWFFVILCVLGILGFIFDPIFLKTGDLFLFRNNSSDGSSIGYRDFGGGKSGGGGASGSW